jgi:hypothetical protein
MIATERFVYIHLHKSGGSFVNECILRFFPQAQSLGYHLPRSLVPEPLRRLPVIGFVRSPWSYYVSWYAFQSQRPQPNALFRCMSHDGALDFKATVRNLLDLGTRHEHLDELLTLLPDRYGLSGLNLPNFALAPIRGSGLGFYAYLFGYMYAGDGEAIFGRTENLRQELLDAFERLGAEVSTPMREFIQTADARNTSRHGDWREYYDADLARAVAARDAGVIERFGYRFDS